MADDEAEHAAVEELTKFFDEIDAEITTWRFDLRDRFGGADALPLYPTDADLPTTTVGTVRTVLLGHTRLQEENARLRKELARRRLTPRDILVRLATAIALSTVLWSLCALLLGAPGRTYEAMIAMCLGVALGQFMIMRDDQHESRVGPGRRRSVR